MFKSSVKKQLSKIATISQELVGGYYQVTLNESKNMVKFNSLLGDCKTSQKSGYFQSTVKF